jgi:ABC-2 type transport system ATP-binding protein
VSQLPAPSLPPGAVAAQAGAGGAPPGARAPRAGAAGPHVASERLSVRYGRRAAVDEVSFAVAAGTVYALLGRNGAGKSSLVRCLLGEQRPTSGRALLFGRPVWRERAALMAEIGVVPEEADAPPGMTAPQLARFCSRLYPRWDGAGLERRLARFAVPPHVPFGKLSKGQKGQVALSLALASSPRLLILDDPTLGLDAIARRAVFEELIGELADRGVTVLLTTHDLAAVEGIADRVGILAAGRLLVDEEIEELKRRIRRIALPRAGAGMWTQAGKALAGFAPLRQVAHAWGVETVVTDYDDERFARWRGSPAGRTAEVASLTLEEIFVALVGEEERP